MKKNIKRVAALSLAAVMLVSAAGCGKKAAEKNTDYNMAEVVAVYDGEDITLGEAFFIVRWQQLKYQQNPMASYLGEEWYTYDLLNNGMTFEAWNKAYTIENIRRMRIAEDYAGENGISLTEDEKETAISAAADFVKANYEEALTAMLADEDMIATILQRYLLTQKVYDQVIANTPITITDEEARVVTYNYVYKATTETDSDGNTVDMSDADKQAIYTNLESMIANARNNGDFKTAAQDAGYTSSQRSFSIALEDKSFQDLNNYVLTMEVGAVSDVIPVDGGYFVLNLVTDNDTEQLESSKESLLEKKQAETFTNLLNEYAADKKFEVRQEVWDTVKTDTEISPVKQTQS